MGLGLLRHDTKFMTATPQVIPYQSMKKLMGAMVPGCQGASLVGNPGLRRDGTEVILREQRPAAAAATIASARAQNL